VAKPLQPNLGLIDGIGHFFGRMIKTTLFGKDKMGEIQRTRRKGLLFRFGRRSSATH